MSLNIQKSVLHQLKRVDDNQFDVLLNDHLLSDSQTTIDLVLSIHHHFNHKSRVFAVFNQQSSFKQMLTNTQNSGMNFIAFSKAAMDEMKTKMINYAFARGGAVLFCHYQYLATDYLLIAIIDNCVSLVIDEQLEIQSSHYLDVDHADMIMRVDLTEWQHDSDSKRYISFLRGRIGRNVDDFFIDYLDATESINVKLQNQTLTAAVTDYCQTIELSPKEKHEIKSRLHDYCKSQHALGEEIELNEIARQLPKNENYQFDEFLKTQEYQIESHFPADVASIRKFKKFSGSGGGVTISFDGDKLGEKIVWNEQNDTLTIHGIPPNLRDQLTRNYKGADNK